MTHCYCWFPLVWVPSQKRFASRLTQQPPTRPDFPSPPEIKAYVLTNNCAAAKSLLSPIKVPVDIANCAVGEQPGLEGANRQLA
jgi:hypothetical protein